MHCFVCRSILPTDSSTSLSLPSTSADFQAAIPSFPSASSTLSISLPSTSADIQDAISSPSTLSISLPSTSADLQIAVSSTPSGSQSTVPAMYLPTTPSPTSYYVVEVQKKVMDAPPPPPPKDAYTLQIEVCGGGSYIGTIIRAVQFVTCCCLYISSTRGGLPRVKSLWILCNKHLPWSSWISASVCESKLWLLACIVRQSMLYYPSPEYSNCGCYRCSRAKTNYMLQLCRYPLSHPMCRPRCTTTCLLSATP